MKASNLIFAAALLFTACGGNSDKKAETTADTTQAGTTAVTNAIEGEWVQPIPGMDGEQGIKIEADGKASSINMATLQYEAWTQNGDTIVVDAKSIGNGQEIAFKETFVLEGDSLVRYNQGTPADKFGRRH